MSVSERLEAAVAEHRLEFDPGQARAAERLDALAAALRVPDGGVLQGLRSRVSWFPQGARQVSIKIGDTRWSQPLNISKPAITKLSITRSAP